MRNILLFTAIFYSTNICFGQTITFDKLGNGVELGIINMKLLEKIEESALYTLEAHQKMKTAEDRAYWTEQVNRPSDHIAA